MCWSLQKRLQQDSKCQSLVDDENNEEIIKMTVKWEIDENDKTVLNKKFILQMCYIKLM